MSDFKLAADAIISGDKDTLERLLNNNPQLIQERSAREHAERGATLDLEGAAGVGFWTWLRTSSMMMAV